MPLHLKWILFLIKNIKSIFFAVDALQIFLRITVNAKEMRCNLNRGNSNRKKTWNSFFFFDVKNKKKRIKSNLYEIFFIIKYKNILIVNKLLFKSDNVSKYKSLSGNIYRRPNPEGSSDTVTIPKWFVVSNNFFSFLFLY